MCMSARVQKAAKNQLAISKVRPHLLMTSATKGCTSAQGGCILSCGRWAFRATRVTALGDKRTSGLLGAVGLHGGSRRASGPWVWQACIRVGLWAVRDVDNEHVPRMRLEAWIPEQMVQGGAGQTKTIK